MAYKSTKELLNKGTDFIEPIHKTIALRQGVNYKSRRSVPREEDPYQFRLDDNSIIFSSHQSSQFLSTGRRRESLDRIVMSHMQSVINLEDQRTSFAPTPSVVPSLYSVGVLNSSSRKVIATSSRNDVSLPSIYQSTRNYHPVAASASNRAIPRKKGHL